MMQVCIEKAKDYSTMLMLAACYSDAALMKHVSELAGDAQYFNIQFMADFMQKDVHGCFNILMADKRYPEVCMKMVV